jgi:hypothetical protein
MLRVFNQDGRLGRREFLRIGSLGLGGLSLPALLGSRASAAQTPVTTGRSVVFLFLHGGPTQVETFDPKMTAPSSIRSVDGEIQTAIPGVTFGSRLPLLAALAERVSIVRSFTTGDGNHDIKPIVSRHSDNANLGSLYSRVVGANDPVTGLPTNALLFPKAVRPEAQPGTMSFGNFSSTGTLGSSSAPFMPGAGGDLQKDMELNLPVDRLDSRRELLVQLDRLRAAHDAAGLLGAIDPLRAQAFETILSGAADAFDLTREDPKTLARYDTAPLIRPEHISSKWNNRKYYIDYTQSLGKQMLLARRLCEAGCGFVTVSTNFVWDMHADSNNATMEEGMRYMAPPLDRAVSAFLEDVEARGLSEKILLVVTGEMGRTPKINSRGGRDHWGSLAPLLLAGGGLEMGRVIGQSSRDVAEPASEPVTIPHLVATILQTVFNVGELRLRPDVPSEVIRLASAEPIPGL